MDPGTSAGMTKGAPRPTQPVVVLLLHMSKFFRKYQKYVTRQNYIVAIAVVQAVTLMAIMVPAALIWPSNQYVLTSASSVKDKDIAVGIVLGAGVKPNGTPYRELQARLDAAAEALDKGYVQKLIVSGDNRFSHYDEPNAMKRYLVESKRVDPIKIQSDFAGRSTYESCERASKIFGLKKAILISAPSHLPRAIYLCRHFGIEAYGIGSSAAFEANNATRREVMARAKAVWNVYFMGEPTVLGSPIKL